MIPASSAVFLSYHSPYRTAVATLLRGRADNGIDTLLDTFLDRATHALGAPWFGGLQKALGSTRAVIIFVGERSMSVGERLSLYQATGPAMFDKAVIPSRIKYLYKWEPLAKQLRKTFGAAPNLAPANQKTLLLIVSRNVPTDSARLSGSNPLARYNAQVKGKATALSTSTSLGWAFLHVRYNAEPTSPWLNRMRMGDINPNKISQLDSVDYINDLNRIGRRGGQAASLAHFNTFTGK